MYMWYVYDNDNDIDSENIIDNDMIGRSDANKNGCKRLLIWVWALYSMLGYGCSESEDEFGHFLFSMLGLCLDANL